MIPAKEFEGELWIRAADIHLLARDKPRTWIGLTYEEINDILHSHDEFNGSWELIDMVEAKLRQKNGFAEEKNT